MTRSANILVGDARARLREIPAGSVQCCVTSPPYWGLRDYGTGRWDGGDPACDHRASTPSRTANAIATGGLDGSKATCHASSIYGSECGRCGATRVDRQLGLERTPEEYVANMVDVFRDVCRVLRPDGTLWLNLGDSYAGSGKGGNPDEGKQATNRGSQSIGVLYGKTGETARHAAVTNVSRDVHGMAPKQLIGIPWRVAFALQADGWWLRSDIVWSKPNPMPESVTDRPTKAHEYLFLLSKSASYFYDVDAIREPEARPWTGENNGQIWVSGEAQGVVLGRATDPNGGLVGSGSNPSGRNRRTVWTIATQPFAGAHFAVMPEALVEPCVLAGSKHGDLVLDPFAGAGTVGVVALKHGRSFVGVELNPKYAAMARNRIHDDAPLLNRALVSGGEAA